MKDKLFLLSLMFIFYSHIAYSQIIEEKQNRAELGAILAITGHKPILLNSYNKDFNLVQD